MRPRATLLPIWAWVLVDILVINLASILAWYIRYQLRWFPGVDTIFFFSPLSSFTSLFIGLTIVLVLAFWANRVYRIQRGTSWVDEMFRIGNGVLIGIVLMVAATFGIRPLAFSRLLFVYDAVLILLLLGLVRLVRRWVDAQLRARGHNLERVLIVGGQEMGRAVMRAMVAQPELGYQVIGFVDDDPDIGTTDVGRFKALGTVQQFENIVNTEQVNEAIITLPWQEQATISRLIRICERLGVRPRVVPDMLQLNLSRVSIEELSGIPLIGIKPQRFTESTRLAKRVLDLTMILLGAPIALFSTGMLALFIRLDSRGPVLFTQTRIGKNGKPFKVFKFRSMQSDAEAQQGALESLNEATGPLFKIKDDPRLTRVGRTMRRFSLDELPQLINVLRGEMSLVGPRPNLPQEVEQYKPWHRKRLQVKPGMTGLWQVSGRSDVAFDEMCLLDIYYIENWSLILDISVLLRTIRTVISGSGAY